MRAVKIFISNIRAVSPTSPAETPQQDRNALEMAYAKNDFVPNDEIFFEDLMDNEHLGEFPSMWDLVAGNALPTVQFHRQLLQILF